MGVNNIKIYNFMDKGEKKGFMNLETSGERASLYFYGEICGDSWQSEWYEEDKAPQDVADFLKELDGSSKPLDVFVNSGGGDVFGGIAIYNILKRYQGEKTAYIDGLAGSIAGIIPFACDKVIAPKSAQIMLHKPYTYCHGNADDMRKSAESLDVCEKSIVSIYMNHVRNGTTEENVQSMIDNETWLTCEQAAEYFNIELIGNTTVRDYIKAHTPRNSAQKRKLQLENDLFRLRNEVKNYD